MMNYPVAPAIAVLLSVTPVWADTGLLDSMEISGRLSTDAWYYPEEAVYPDQRSWAGGLALETTFYMEDEEDRSFTLTPFLRYDAGDPERTHIDLREAYYLTYGDIGDDEWELRTGFDQVFWGVVESRPLVDIVNQTDYVEHPNERTKLGQLMLHFTRSGEWGALELFAMSGHRERTYPGRYGRQRSGLVVASNLVSYESAAKEWHIDLAGRYSANFGALDLGLSLFDGTSREPLLVPAQSGPKFMLVPYEFMLVPYYEQIRQYGIDAQITLESLILKLEAIYRTDAKYSLVDEFLNLRIEEDDYAASVVGGEYTFYSVWGSDTDIGLFVEWAYDERGRWAANAFENDLFVALHVGLNDVQTTEFVFSSLSSLHNDSHLIGAEFKRRLSDNWYLHIESVKYLETDEADALYPVQRDSHIRVRLDYNF